MLTLNVSSIHSKEWTRKSMSNPFWVFSVIVHSFAYNLIDQFGWMRTIGCWTKVSASWCYLLRTTIKCSRDFWLSKVTWTCSGRRWPPTVSSKIVGHTKAFLVLKEPRSTVIVSVTLRKYLNEIKGLKWPSFSQGKPQWPGLFSMKRITCCSCTWMN